MVDEVLVTPFSVGRLCEFDKYRWEADVPPPIRPESEADIKEGIGDFVRIFPDW